MAIVKATLSDGSTVDFDDNMIGEGGMKYVYFTKDKKSVVCFFKDQNQDINRINRLEAIIGKFNPTLDPLTGDYWKTLFCWPTAIVISPQLGVMAPSYPKDYFFETGPFKGKEKEGTWFIGPKVSKLIPDKEKGAWINYFKLCILMSRAVRRLHQAGLAHSDLSVKNILIDPSKGQSIVIDIDSLVVKGLFPPDVLGTPKYIAPEVLKTVHLPLNDPNRNHPEASTDQHALAVLIYQYLLFRHPLEGPKVHSTVSAEEDDRLSMGAKALFIEHPSDSSNRPQGIKVSAKALGPYLNDLFLRAFVNGLHSPNDRPAATEWERGLMNTWDILLPCANSSCTHKWFVYNDITGISCPFCNFHYRGSVPLLKLRKETRPGQWMAEKQLLTSNNSQVDKKIAVYDGLYLFNWHVFDNAPTGENADRTPQAYCAFHQGQWLLINQNLDSLTSQSGNRVPKGQAVTLTHGTQIRLSQEPHGRIIEVQIIST